MGETGEQEGGFTGKRVYRGKQVGGFTGKRKNILSDTTKP